MPKLVDKKPITLDHLSGSLDRLSNLVEKGFLAVRSELSKKADKTDIVGLKTDIVDLQNDISRLAKATKLGFDEVHTRFKKVDGEFGKMKVEFEKIDDRFGGVENRLSNLDRRLDIFVTHEKRLVKVERELGFAV
ncbi:MAG TPA: hypothetical protein VJB69_01795 [Candidatus Paceibacterota bacterium]